MAKWHIKENDANINLMSDTLGIDPFLCKLLANRNVRTKNTAIKFLNPIKKFMSDNLGILGMKEAIDFILHNNDKKIAIYGDYDVDGVCSTTILYKGLEPIIKNLSFYIPHREHEGYGLNKKAISNLADNGIQIILACDNGITAIEEIEYAKSLGISFVIIDHHEPIIKNGEEILPDAIIVNPKQNLCNYQFKSMCAAGLSYKFIEELYKSKSMNFLQEKELLIFAAIATLCDVVELQGENRIIVRLGLDLLKEPITNIGLYALVKEKNLVYINEEAIGFSIGPCINAAGRLNTAMMAVELFLSNNKEKAKNLAKQINELNEQRKELTQTAMNMILEDDESASIANTDKVIVLYKPKIHESVAGIVAGRIKDMMYKPTIVITSGEEGAKGSARSIEGYNIYGSLASYRHLFIKFGGHEMAAGLSLVPENIQALREGLNKDFGENIEELIEIDAELDLDKATYKLTQDIDILRPFGKANEAPVFVSYGVTLYHLRMIEEKNTLIFTFETQTGRSIKGLSFGRGAIDKFINMIYNSFSEEEAEQIFNGVLRNIDIKFDIVYYVEMNSYNGISNVQLKIKDFLVQKRINNGF